MFKLVVRYLEHTPVIGEQNNTAIVIFMLSLIYLKAPTLWVIQHRAETSGRSLPLNTQHITSALGSQVDQGRCFKNNPPFHPCQSLLFLFRHGSRKKKKKYSNNKISASAKYQTWPWKHAVQDVPFSEVVVVAVGDVRWSQKHNRLVSGGRWGCHNPKPTLDLPLSFPQPQAVKLHNFSLKALVMSYSWNVTGWEIVFLLIHVQENKGYYNHVFSQVMVSFCGSKKPSASLESNVDALTC